MIKVTGFSILAPGYFIIPEVSDKSDRDIAASTSPGNNQHLLGLFV
jgi:hypothetical protein